MTLNLLFFPIARPLIYNIPRVLTILLVLYFLGSWLAIKFAKKFSSNLGNKLIVLLVILIGLYFRLCFAIYFRGNFDLWFWGEAAKMAYAGENIYASSALYNYFPPWIIILGFLEKVSQLFPILNIYFLIRFFLTLIDCLILFVLYLISKQSKITFLPLAIGFFLNPVIVIITGFHGQFENIGILLVLFGVYLYKKNKKILGPWLSITFGGIVKHMFFPQIVLFLTNVFPKKMSKVLQYSFLSILIAILTLLPYWPGAHGQIIKDLFLSVYTRKNYGVPYILGQIGLGNVVAWYPYFFIIVFILSSFLFKPRNLWRACLMGNLFFIAFTPAMSDQFFILPLAMGLLTGSRWFYVYSLISSLYLYGSLAQFNIAPYRVFSWNLICLVAVLWLFSEYRKRNET